MAELDYSKHARERLAQRRVIRHQVAAAINNPDELYEDAASAALIAIKRTKGSSLVIVYVASEEGRRRVVTLYNASDVGRLIRRKLERRVWRRKA